MRSHICITTFTLLIFAYAKANLNLTFIGNEEVEQKVEHEKVFLDENEYLEIDLVDYNGLQYTAKTGLGSNNVEQSLLFDTGSSNLWVTSVFCENSGSCDNNYSSLYDPKSSDASKFRGLLRHKENLL